MKVALIIFFVMSFLLKVLQEKNKKKVKATKLKMEEASLEVKYKEDIGIIIATKQLYTFFNNFNLAKHWPVFKAKIKEEIRIVTQPVTYLDLGISRFGGCPDLPKDVSWFTENNGNPLTFLAQINLSELSNKISNLDLPKTGILYFFYTKDIDFNGMDYNKDKFKVFYSKDLNNLERKQRPTSLTENDVYKVSKLLFSKAVSLPYEFSDFVFKTLNVKERHIYGLLTYPKTNNKLLGHSDNIQFNMTDDCQLVTNNIVIESSKDYKKQHVKKLLAKKNDWQLLFQLDSDSNSEMMWGDCGRLYFWIKKEDLKEQNFNNCWLILQYY